jgi:hypothetical protein
MEKGGVQTVEVGDGFWHAFVPEAQGDVNGPALCVLTDCSMFILGYTDSLCAGTCKHI